MTLIKTWNTKEDFISFIVSSDFSANASGRVQSSGDTMLFCYLQWNPLYNSWRRISAYISSYKVIFILIMWYQNINTVHLPYMLCSFNTHSCQDELILIVLRHGLLHSLRGDKSLSLPRNPPSSRGARSLAVTMLEQTCCCRYTGSDRRKRMLCSGKVDTKGSMPSWWGISTLPTNTPADR